MIAALERALARLFALDSQLFKPADALPALAHRLARYLEAELQQELLTSHLVVDLAYNGQAQFSAEVAPAAGIVPSLAVHSRQNASERPLAIECRRNLLGPRDKKRLLALEGHPGGYELVFGIAWKPQGDRFLFYYLADGAVRYRRVRKDRVRLLP